MHTCIHIKHRFLLLLFVGTIKAQKMEAVISGIYKRIKSRLNYLCFLKNSIESLKGEAKEFKEARAWWQMMAYMDYNAEEVPPALEHWLREASEIQAKMSEIETEITIRQNGCFSLKSRISLGKKVEKTVGTMKELLEPRHAVYRMTYSHPSPAPIFEFESRKTMEEEITTSLRDNKANKVGICGMGGVGKTTMAKRIMRRVKEEHLFEEIVMVNVKQYADMSRIQDDIAASLGLNLGEGSVSSKAHLLRTRLSESTKRSLIILDDVWEDLKLDDLGIPCGKNCKVLITSRNKDILNIEKIHVVDLLSPVEAWDFFKTIVGSCTDHPDILSVAQQVVDKCKGLPIALLTVGSALEAVEDTSVWKDWLDQLKSSNTGDMKKFINGIYKPLKLSYEYLRNERAQSIFLLCCLYPEDYDITVDELTSQAVGLDIVPDKRLEEARKKVCSSINLLKCRFLLLEGISKNHVKMHNILRDAAILIASDEKWITSDFKINDCTCISPYVGERIEHHAGSIVFQNFHLLWIDRRSSDEELVMDDHFFEGMKELKVLSIKYPSLRRLPQTTKLLKNLRTLVLDRCGSLESITVFGELVNLEIFICRGCSSIKSLPVEIGSLRGLKLLELSNCENLKTIAPGIISNLKGLEELVVEGCYDGWEGENMENERKNASLSEIEELSNLSHLKIEIMDSRLAAEYIQLSSNLERYHIKIGSVRNYRGMLYEKTMELALEGSTSLGKWIRKCANNVEYMYLEGDSSRDLDFEVAHENIRELVFRKCSTVKKLVSVKTNAPVFPLLEVLQLGELNELEEILDIDGAMPSICLNNLNELRLEKLPALEHLWKTSSIISPCPEEVSIFNQLSSVHVFGCHRLHSLFSSSMMSSGSSLSQLERLEILECDGMEQVLLWDDEDNRTVRIFPKLKFLRLNTLPRLTSFSKGIENIELPMLEKMQVQNCPLKSFTLSPTGSSHGQDYEIHLFRKPVKLDCLSKLELNYGDIEMGKIRCPLIPVEFFPGLCKLKIWRINGLKSLFSLSTIEKGCLLHLSELEIVECNMMEEVILWNEEEKQTDINVTLFLKLKHVTLRSLPKLTSFSKGIQFHLSAKMKISNCPLLENCVSTSSWVDNVYSFGKTDKVEEHSRQLEERSIEQKEERGRWSEGSSSEKKMNASIQIMEEHGGWSEGSSAAQKMKAPIEIMEEHNSGLEGGEEESSDGEFEKLSSRRPMENENRVNDDLESSKDHVVPQRCLEHCRLFIPDCEFDKAKLVRMWIAEECIELGAAKKLEDVGSIYFDALVHKQIIIASKFDNLHMQMKYKFNTSQVSDGILKRGDYVSINASKLYEIYGEASYLTWQCEKIDRTLFDAVKNLKHLHTLVVHVDSPLMSELPGEIFLGLELLKTLDLSCTHIEELPGSIGKLKSLRYLDVSETPIKRLPESLDRLDCLQTLNLNACFGLFALPRGMGRLVDLRHLDLDILSQLKSMPREMGKLTKLQTLRAFLVGKNAGCSIKELKNMNEIAGSFCISRLENVSDAEEAMEAALLDKKYIEKLELRWQNCGNKDTSDILEFLKPHSNLKELRLTNYGGSKLPSWISNPSYADLVSITLCKCTKCDIMPSVGKLPSLKILSIVDMENLRNINTLFCRNHEAETQKAFPRLEKLTLDSMPALEEWTGVEDGDFPWLAHISIRYCPKLRVLPSLLNLRSLQHLEINDCSQLSSLPEGSLPESLESLIIRGCPELKERCRQDGGLDWSKIASVKSIWIDSEKISHNVQKTSFNGRMPRSYASLPVPLKTLCDCLTGLNEGRGIPIALDNDVFCHKCEIYIHLDDLISFCDLEPITEMCMIVYIWNLYNKMKLENTLRRFQFVDPFSMSYAQNRQSDMRASALADSFNSTSPNQLVLVPCNVGEHWILTVIQPYKEVVWSLDPVGHNINEPWKDVVNMAISKFNDNLGKKGKEPTWEVIKAPLHPDFKLSGYYVMCYVKEIVQGLKMIDSSSPSSLFVKEEYTLNEINEVRIEWAVCVQKHVPISIEGGSMKW